MKKGGEWSYMNLDYFTLLSYEPVHLQNVGSVKSPLLKDLAGISLPVYHFYLSILMMDIKTYYQALDHEKTSYFQNLSKQEIAGIIQIRAEYEALSDLEKSNLVFYDIMIFDPKMRGYVLSSLNFFLSDDIEYIESERQFATYNSVVDKNNKHPTGYIHRGVYHELADVILQRVNAARKNTGSENQKVKNKKAASLLAKIQKGREQQKQKADAKLELGNIISALSSHHKTINMTNIWDLTVYQLWDQFIRQRFDDAYLLQSTCIAFNGDKDGKFDSEQWFSLIHEH